MNIPNLLSLFRLLLIPLVAYLFHVENITAAAIVFMLACLTDIVDGYIARRFDMTTDLGKLLDPLADKGMQLTVLASMAFCSLVPWFVVIFILCKELLMCIGGALLYRSKVVVSANWYGKAATVVTSVCVVAILLLHSILHPVLLAALQWTPVAFAIFAFLMYAVVYIDIKKTAN